jgi:hypothetical protein
VTAPKMGAPGAGVGAGSQAQGDDQHRDSASQAEAVQSRDSRKTLADYAAMLALHGGYSLHELADGGFLIC